MRNAYFSIEALSDQLFDGYTGGQYWNGFACPYFSFEGASRIVSAWQSHGWLAAYDQVADAFVFSVGHDYGTGEPEGHEAFASVEAEGRRLYPIGAMSWTWDERQLDTQSHCHIAAAERAQTHP